MADEPHHPLQKFLWLVSARGIICAGGWTVYLHFYAPEPREPEAVVVAKPKEPETLPVVPPRITMTSGDDFTLNEGEVLTSPNGRYRLRLGEGGHVQVCKVNVSSSCQDLHQTPKTIVDLLGDDLDFTRLLMQNDGNLALYAWTKAGSSIPICAIGWAGAPGIYTFSLQDDGAAIARGSYGTKVVSGFACATQAQVDRALADDWNANSYWISAKQHLQFVFVESAHLARFQAFLKDGKSAMQSAIDAQSLNPDAGRKIRAFGQERTKRFVECWKQTDCRSSIVFE